MTESTDTASFDDRNLIFVGGAPRSGTTLVQRILGAHPQIYAGPEFDLIAEITALYQRHISFIDNGRIAKIIDHQQATDAFQALVFSLFKDKAQQHQAQLISEKTPANCLIFDQLRELLPASKKILVLRNPADIFKSMRAVAQRYQQDNEPVPPLIDSPSACVKTISQYQQSGIASSKKHRDIFIIHYEQLLDRPQSVCEALCKFLAIEFSPEMIAIEGKALEAPAGDSEKWYSQSELRNSIDKTKLKPAQPAAISLEDQFHHYLLNKYIAYNSKEMAGYAPAASPKWLQYYFLLKEYRMGNKQDKKMIRRQLRGKQQ